MTVDKYEVQQLISHHEEGDAFKGAVVGGTSEVLIHIMPADGLLAKEARALFARRQPPELLFVGNHEGRFCVVAQQQSQCLNLREWLNELRVSSDDPLSRGGAWKVPAPGVQPSGPPPPVAPASSDPGDFTRLFQTSSTSSVPAEAPPPAPTKPSGEFTRMFSAVDPSSARPVESRKGPDSHQPGDFTRMFQTPSPVPNSYSAEPVKQPSSPSDFTRLFPAPAAPVPPPVQERTDQAATGIFTSPPTVETPRAAPLANGPSEFTRVIAVPRPIEIAQPTALPVPQPLPAPPIVKPAEPEAKNVTPSYLPLILILNALFLAAVALVVYFVLKR